MIFICIQSTICVEMKCPKKPTTLTLCNPFFQTTPTTIASIRMGGEWLEPFELEALVYAQYNTLNGTQYCKDVALRILCYGYLVPCVENFEEQICVSQCMKDMGNCTLLDDGGTILFNADQCKTMYGYVSCGRDPTRITVISVVVVASIMTVCIVGTWASYILMKLKGHKSEYSTLT
jgi:hypothetical protein